MPNLLILYDTTEGQTARIARRMADVAADAGHRADARDLRQLPGDLPLDRFDGVILGASIHRGSHSRQATRFVRDHRSQLESVPSAFFSVSLSAAGATERQQHNARRCLDDFLRQVGWTPALTATFAGALLYREYGFLKRLLMKWIVSREGGDTDTSRNYEYTDWNRVADFTRQFLRQLPPHDASRLSPD